MQQQKIQNRENFENVNKIENPADFLATSKFLPTSTLSIAHRLTHHNYIRLHH